jgi:hypothetical protein
MRGGEESEHYRPAAISASSYFTEEHAASSSKRCAVRIVISKILLAGAEDLPVLTHNGPRPR